MDRLDQPADYAGWQAVDPCASLSQSYDGHRSSCGPCSVEALKRGDISQDYVASFYSSLNSYVRFFYEDDESEWGHSPFNQYRYPMSRMILTKSVKGSHEAEDFEDIANNYRANASDNEVFAKLNACQGFSKNIHPIEYKVGFSKNIDADKGDENQKFDVKFEVQSPENVMIGQTVEVPVTVSNTSSETRNIKSTICIRSASYAGKVGPCLKKTNFDFKLEPNQNETIYMKLDSCNYMNKMGEMSLSKIIVTGFVKETGQSFVDEFDYRYNKPSLKIEVSKMKLGADEQVNLSFNNPLDITLSNCFVTLEVNGSVRPRTMRLNRDLRPGEKFSSRCSVAPRAAGERSLVACFTSDQLSDVVGQQDVYIEE